MISPGKIFSVFMDYQKLIFYFLFYPLLFCLSGLRELHRSYSVLQSKRKRFEQKTLLVFFIIFYASPFFQLFRVLHSGNKHMHTQKESYKQQFKSSIPFKMLSWREMSPFVSWISDNENNHKSLGKHLTSTPKLMSSEIKVP